ncbi:MAG: radical SAM family heme chaperone HemW [Nitrospirae bacterium]|nr:radical SAM family heme chaperone HemW [Candidatus Manganitrophaceae bacterium]
MTPVGLYIDFPFCLARCAFCAFNIQGYREGLAGRYADALQKEIDLYANGAGAPFWQNRTITSLYLGGGTPSLYAPGLLTGLIALCRERLPVAASAEVTLEAHPATIDADNLGPLRQGGINRLSMGVQSFSDAHLDALGRHHTAERARTAFLTARAAGFTNIGIDLIYGLPDQSPSDWEETLQAAVDLAPEHLSLYALSIEEGSLFYKKAKAGLLSLPSEEEAIVQYQTARVHLAAAGYRHYEVSNFARPGFESRHNLFYWDRGEVLGIGLSAHSYLDQEHRANTDSLQTYLDAIESSRLPIDRVEKVTLEGLSKDRVIFGLRKVEGIPVDYLNEGPSLRKTAERLIAEGLLRIEQGRVQLTSKGLLLADEIAVAFL